jgi:hypothetical protein
LTSDWKPDCALYRTTRRDQVVAAFDFDGTITASDSLPDFVRYAVGSRRLIYGAIRAAPWLAGMLIGACDRGTAKAHFLAETIGAATRCELEDAAQRYAAQRLPALVRPEMAYWYWSARRPRSTWRPGLRARDSTRSLRPNSNFVTAAFTAAWLRRIVGDQKKCDDCNTGSSTVNRVCSMRMVIVEATRKCSRSPIMRGYAATAKCLPSMHRRRTSSVPVDLNQRAGVGGRPQ